MPLNRKMDSRAYVNTKWTSIDLHAIDSQFFIFIFRYLKVVTCEGPVPTVLPEGIYEVNDDDGTLDIDQICEAENPKLTHHLVMNPESSPLTPTENRQEVQAKAEKYECCKCLKIHKSKSGLCKHVKLTNLLLYTVMSVIRLLLKSAEGS